ncbi:MAG: glutamate racemase [Bacillota bacterium]
MIGIFDSGVGGLTVLATALRILPNEDFIYFGDSKNAPYGIKSKSEVIKLSKKICDKLIKNYNVKAIVIACNTATSAAIDILRKYYNIPIIGMEPAIKPALEDKDTKKTLVLATEMTLKEKKYKTLLQSLKDNQKVINKPCSKLVESIEKIEFNSGKVNEIVDKCIDSYKDIDSIVLGCTHFLFIKTYLLENYNFKIFDGNLGTVLNLKNILNKDKNLKNINENRKVIIKNSGNKQKNKLSKKLLEIYIGEINERYRNTN